MALFGVLTLSAQIVDDTTKLVYGPTSTRWTNIEVLQHDDTLYQVMDTTLNGLEAFQTKKNLDNYYYDLGNNGTALVPMYFQAPEMVGRTSGFHAYEPYVKKPKDFKYYDTKSPYIHFGAVFGGKGRNVVDFEFSRNVTPNWNIGFDIRRIATQKQIGSASLRERQVLGTNLDFYTHYNTKNRKYHAIFHAFKMDHQVSETGGLLDGTNEEDYFRYQDASINLKTASSSDFRTRLYLYQQYSIKPFFEIYHVIQKSNIRNEFNDPNTYSTQGQAFYDYHLIRLDSTKDASQYEELSNEVGIKGRLGERIFYSGFLKRRDIDFRYHLLTPYDHTVESYLGGDIKINITKTNQIGGEAEVNDAGQYFFKGYFQNNFLRASYKSGLYRPSFMVERFFGNHNEWANSFNDTFINTIEGSVFYELPFLRIEPQVELTTVTDYIYFDETIRPITVTRTGSLPLEGRGLGSGFIYTAPGIENGVVRPFQNNGTLLVNKFGLNADFTVAKHWHFDNHIIFNNVAGDNPEVMRMPNWNYFGRWYYANILFNGDMDMQLGFDIRWQSSFFGNGYDPTIQQFYVQDDLEVKSYLVADLFLIVKSNDLTLFFKFNYLNQKRDEGYFELANYPGMRRVFDIGFRWMFFD